MYIEYYKRNILTWIFLLVKKRGELVLVCDIEDMILVENDGVWKCDLVETLKQAK